VLKHGEEMFSHREIICQENLALIMVKICHLGANQVKQLAIEGIVPYLDHNLIIVRGES
jgi:hypothetical protein